MFQIWISSSGVNRKLLGRKTNTKVWHLGLGCILLLAHTVQWQQFLPAIIPLIIIVSTKSIISICVTGEDSIYPVIKCYINHNLVIVLKFWNIKAEILLTWFHSPHHKQERLFKLKHYLIFLSLLSTSETVGQRPPQAQWTLIAFNVHHGWRGVEAIISPTAPMVKWPDFAVWLEAELQAALNSSEMIVFVCPYEEPAYRDRVSCSSTEHSQ